MLMAWANRWNIPLAASMELIQLLGAGEPVTPVSTTTKQQSEAALQGKRRLKAALSGGRLVVLFVTDLAMTHSRSTKYSSRVI